MNLFAATEEFQPVDHDTAKAFIEKWHYSNRVPTGKNIFFGWFRDGMMYAVANYGIGVNPYQAAFLSRTTGEGVSTSNLVELKRLCRVEPKKAGLYLSSFLAKCHRKLKKMGYRYVVSFSDPEHGHSGGIYRASNFQHLGQTGSEWHLVDEEGQKRHRRVAYRHSRVRGVSISEAREQLGLTRIKTAPKDRWFYAI